MRLVTAIALLPIVAAMVACGGDEDSTSGAADWPSFFALADLVDSSDIVVVARISDEQTLTIDAPDAPDGSRTSIVEVVRTFVVDESLKGDLLPGDLFNVFNTASVAVTFADGHDPAEVVYQVLKVDKDQSYLLFLTLVAVPDFYPAELGKFAWAAPGEPHTARVLDDGTLLWETTGRYDESRDARDIPVGVQGAGPAFDVALAVVAALAEIDSTLAPHLTPSRSP